MKQPEPAFSPSAKLKFVPVDVTDWDSLRNMFIQANDCFGRIDHVIANAGVASPSKLLDVTLDDEGKLTPPDFRTIDVNLLALVSTVRLAAAYMSELANERPSGMGSIVLMTSIASVLDFPATDYAISKHGVLGVIRGLKQKLEGKIRINAVAPGWTDTAIVPPGTVEALGAMSQAPDKVARAVALLISDEQRHGEVIYSWEGRYREINKAPGGIQECHLKLLA